jgi:hypothetical protein
VWQNATVAGPLVLRPCSIVSVSIHACLLKELAQFSETLIAFRSRGERAVRSNHHVRGEYANLIWAWHFIFTRQYDRKTVRVVFQELLHDFTFLIDRDYDNDQILATIFAVQFIERRSIGAARRAPRRPEIEQDRPALQTGQRNRITLDIRVYRSDHRPTPKCYGRQD